MARFLWRPAAQTPSKRLTGVCVTIPRPVRSPVTLKLLISVGSWNSFVQFAVPTHWGEPSASQLVNESHTTTPSGTIAQIAKYVIAGRDQRKLGRPIFKPPEPLVCPLLAASEVMVIR